MFLRTRSTKRIIAAVATVVLVGTVSGCASESEQIAEDMKTAVAEHQGDWSEADLRAAAGDHADQIETVTVSEDGSGGVVYFVTESHDKGDTYTSKKTKKSSSGKKKTTTTTKTHDEWEVECVKATVDGTTVTAEEYERESSTAEVTCAS